MIPAGTQRARPCPLWSAVIYTSAFAPYRRIASVKMSKVIIPEVKEGPEFSRLESTLVTNTEIKPRPQSKDGNFKWRHAIPQDTEVNELDYQYDVDTDSYPFAAIGSVHDSFSGVMYSEHLRKRENFDIETTIDCLSVDGAGAKWLQLDQSSLERLLKDTSDRCINVPAIATHPAPDPISSTRKALMFFIPITPLASDETSFKQKLPMTQTSVTQLFTLLQLDHAFLQNLLGRPDYWGTHSRWHEEDGKLLECDFFCQHPRWNLQAQGAPLSVYTKYDVQRDLLVHIISYKTNDKVVLSLRQQLDTLTRHKVPHHIAHILLDSPLDLQVMISNLNFETSKWHVERFRRFQWSVVNEVDDHFAGIEERDRQKLADWLKNIQIMAQGVDSHLANAQVFLYTAKGIQDMASRLNVSKKGTLRQRTLDMVSHLIMSMEKQQMWFLNYKGRKDTVMNLIFHFNTQTDALNSIELAADMKKDSTSMSAIAGLTMVFLPGTVIAVRTTHQPSTLLTVM